MGKGGKGGEMHPPEGQKQVPSPEPEKWVPIKKSLIYSNLYPFFLSFFIVHVSSSNQTE